MTFNNNDEQHSLPSYPDEVGGGANHLASTENESEAKLWGHDLFGLASVFGQRSLRRAHAVLTITLAVVLMAVLIQNANHGRREPVASLSTADAGSSSGSGWLPLPPNDAVLHSIAFGSCMKEDVPQPFWDTLVQLRPNVTLLGGDNVYMKDVRECQDMECLDLKRAYEELNSHPSFQGAKAVLPMVAQLDDHDYGQNDGWRHNPYKEVAKQMFLEWLEEPLDSPRRREGEGLYTYYEWGPLGQRVQLILLDTRYGRDQFIYSKQLGGYLPDHQDKGKRMLSHAQWQWLEFEVLARPANIRLILSTVQVMAEGDWGFEGWNKIPHELSRLKELLRKTCTEVEQPSLPILLSGDRHMGAYYYDPHYDLNEVTASSFTHTIPAGYDADGIPCQGADCIENDLMRVGEGADGIVWVNHFGLVTFHWKARNVEVALLRAETSPGHAAKTKWNENTDAGQILKTLTLHIP